MDRVKTLQIFLRVADSQSFSRAAEILQLPRSTISAVIAQLERDLNVRLFQRTTRSVSLTADGYLLAERARPLLHELDQINALFRQDCAVSGKIRIDVPNRMATSLIIPALPEFLDQHPQLELILGASDRAVDLIQEGIDCVIRVGQNQHQQLVARPLGHLRMVNCASPDYLRRFGTPQTPADLQQHRVIQFASQHGVADWEYLENSQIQQLKLSGQITVNQADSYLACALAGLGLIQVPEYDVQTFLQHGQLVSILPEFCPPAMPVAALYPHRRNVSQRLRVFLNWVENLFKTIA